MANCPWFIIQCKLYLSSYRYDEHTIKEKYEPIHKTKNKEPKGCAPTQANQIKFAQEKIYQKFRKCSHTKNWNR